jgi:hypothetical protein
LAIYGKGIKRWPNPNIPFPLKFCEFCTLNKKTTVIDPMKTSVTFYKGPKSAPYLVEAEYSNGRILFYSPEGVLQEWVVAESYTEKLHGAEKWKLVKSSGSSESLLFEEPSFLIHLKTP